MLKILVAIKDDTGPLDDIFRGMAYETVQPESASRHLSAKPYDLLVYEGSVETLPAIKASDPRLDVILIGGGGQDGIEAVKLGATAYFSRPLDLSKLKECIEGIEDFIEVRKEAAALEKQLDDKFVFAGVVGKNTQMLDLFNFIRRIAPYYKVATVMGETGSGKEEMAKALHSTSPVSGKPFIALNCGGLVEHLIESEFFGHKKGSFTGAVSDKIGVFEAAGEGTVFLDEIGDLPLSFQPHLLRVLQNGDFRKVGSTNVLKARCRVIAATNRDLSREVAEGRFREDLFFRLTPLVINVPPLRERKDDISLLCRYLLRKFINRTGKRILGISRPAQTALMTYDWPGNVRELENVIEQAAILTSSTFLRLEDIPAYIIASSERRQADVMDLEEVIKRHIETVLERHNGNRTTASKVLGISRRALLRRIEKYTVEKDTAKSAHLLKKTL